MTDEIDEPNPVTDFQDLREEFEAENEALLEPLASLL